MSQGCHSTIGDIVRQPHCQLRLISRNPKWPKISRRSPASDLRWGLSPAGRTARWLYLGCPPSAQRRTNATSRPAQLSNSNQHQRIHIAAARGLLRTRNENASSCIRLCIARPSHLDRTKFIRNFSRIGDQCSRSIQHYRSVNGIPRHRVYGRPRRGRRLAMGRFVGQPGNDQIGPSREQGHRYT
jgi:hypothetical protein